jgi:L-seryl-tRNA(Ser) seleniumtransferase
MSDRRRLLPSVEQLSADPRLESARRLYGTAAVTTQARNEIARLRGELDALEGLELETRLAGLAGAVERGIVRALGAPVRRVINATGVFLHTNLGRAPLPAEVAERLPALATAACDLEIDLESGERGDRSRRLAARLTELTGAPAALVVNNNAAALVLALAGLAGPSSGGERGEPGGRREVIVSRGELVEIGGSFRIPDILEASGARLVEVGTTNRTRLEDYARAIGPATALLLKVHPSNYRMSGFVESAEIAPLAALARERGIPLAVDEGAGLLRRPASPRAPAGFPAGHASVAELLAAGADLVTSSGDKLLGGPQAGLLCGGAGVVSRLARHPLYRALRPGRLVALALDEILARHLAGAPLPLDRLWPEAPAHRERVAAIARRLGGEVVEAEAFAGGGAAPGEGISGAVMALAPSRPDEVAKRLRTGEPAVVGYVRDGRLLLDLRTVDAADDGALAAAVERAMPAARSRP